MCLLSYDCGCLLWPLRESAGGLLVFDVTIDRLDLVFADDFTKFRVQEAVAICPLHQWLIGQRGSFGFSLEKQGEAHEIVAWHTKFGFPNVSESAMKNLYLDLGIALPDLLSGEPELLVLKTRLTKVLKPTWHQEDVIVALNKCSRIETPDAYVTCDFDDQLLDDVIIPQEKAEFKNFKDDCEVGSPTAWSLSCGTVAIGT